ncbi:MAG: hypothetical protein ACTSQP_23500 [Promethearchaeota archaeon]
MSLEFSFKSNNVLWFILIAGIVLLIVVSLLNPNQSQQIYSIMTLFGVLLIFLFITLALLKFWQENR